MGFLVITAFFNAIYTALGQLMLYVDGMEGVASHPGTIQWLYSLIASKVCRSVKNQYIIIGLKVNHEITLTVNSVIFAICQDFSVPPTIYPDFDQKMSICVNIAYKNTLFHKAFALQNHL